MDPVGITQLYNQAEALETTIHKIEEHYVATKQVLRELRQPIKHIVEAIQQMVVASEIKIKEVFSKLLVVAGETEAARVATKTDQLIKEWQQAINDFSELKSLALEGVPELGPLFGQSEETKKTELATEADRPMETEVAAKD